MINDRRVFTLTTFGKSGIADLYNNAFSEALNNTTMEIYPKILIFAPLRTLSPLQILLQTLTKIRIIKFWIALKVIYKEFAPKWNLFFSSIKYFSRYSLFLLQKIMEDNNRRHWTVAILLQLGIRIRYLYESRFGFRPLFTPLTDYSSPWRPKECPKYDFFTQVDHLIFYQVAIIFIQLTYRLSTID